MAFETRDATMQVPHTVDSTVEEIVFKRNRGLPPGAAPEVFVIKRINGLRRTFKVPQAQADAAWAASATRTIQNHLLTIIDAAV